jgi:hypothetical protein
MPKALKPSPSETAIWYRAVRFCLATTPSRAIGLGLIAFGLGWEDQERLKKSGTGPPAAPYKKTLTYYYIPQFVTVALLLRPLLCVYDRWLFLRCIFKTII